MTDEQLDALARLIRVRQRDGNATVAQALHYVLHANTDTCPVCTKGER